MIYRKNGIYRACLREKCSQITLTRSTTGTGWVAELTYPVRFPDNPTWEIRVFEGSGRTILGALWNAYRNRPLERLPSGQTLGHPNP